MKKIKEEQLKIIQEQQKDLNTLFNNVGYLETQKHNLLHQISTLSQEVDKYKIDLEKEYGSVNINVETGEYTEIEKQESNLKVVENA
tara:strand:- start:37096 stop:37356 length:261 start_codon:yes stop_codon:yes gene_type:complete